MMPAGRYYIGDLCYVMTDSEWGECCDLFFDGRTDHGCNQGEFQLKDGRRFACFNTAWGDGYYRSNEDTVHPVDSGSIGCILVSDIRGPEASEPETLGGIMEFLQPFEVSSDEGVMQFGFVVIDTHGEEVIEDTGVEE